MEEKAMIRGYHGTCSKHAQSIAENGLDLRKVKKREDHWLGQGIYFYEDMELARWWADNQCSKPYNRNTYPLIYCADIVVEKNRILDLDKRKQLDDFLDFILQTFEDIRKQYEEKPEFNETTFRAVYFDYFKQLNNIAVIIYTFNKEIAGYAKTRNYQEIQTVKRFSKALGISYHEKQICVSDQNCIRRVEMVYNGEEEVI